jgi:hypothetical protein
LIPGSGIGILLSTLNFTQTIKNATTDLNFRERVSSIVFSEITVPVFGDNNKNASG